MKGDTLASGGHRATFAVAPGLKFNEQEMRADLARLPVVAFCDKYLITRREYDLLSENNDAVNTFAVEMKNAALAYERQMSAENNQEQAAERRECFLTPFVHNGMLGRVIVTRDNPKLKKSQANLVLPKSMRRERTLLPTTGHIIVAKVFDVNDRDISDEFVGKRILFGQMSGTAICFKNYPNWIQLDLSEILAIIHKEDTEIQEEELEPMV